MVSREERRRILGLREINPKLFEVVSDMYSKKHLPDNFQGFDESIFRAMSFNHGVEPFKEHSCMKCGITIFGPKKLLLEHHKTHVTGDKFDKRENETITERYLEY